MKRVFIVFNILLLSLVPLISVWGKGSKEGQGPLPRIRVEGNSLMAGSEKFRLRGVSIADPYELDVKDGFFSEEIFKALSTWNVNVVRVPIHPGYWQAEPEFSSKYLDPIMEWAQKYRFYIILDWHAIGNPISGKAQSEEWKENGFTVYDSSLDLAEKAWLQLAQRYGHHPFVLFELFNEPVALDGTPTWRQWHSRAKSLVTAIREKAPDTVVLVSGWQWTLDLTGWGRMPLEMANIAYVAHVYTAHGQWDKNFGFLGEKYPIVVTEWGFSDTTDKNSHFFGYRNDYGQKFLRYMEEREFSWVAWCFHPRWMPNMIKNWNFDPTSSGQLVKQALLGKNKAPELFFDSPGNKAAVSGKVLFEGRMSDDTALLAVEVKVGGGEFSLAESSFTPSYKAGIWSFEWNSYKSANGVYPVTVRVTDASMNKTEKSITLVLENPSDVIPPEVVLREPLPGPFDGEIRITGEAADASGLDEIKIYMDEEILLDGGDKHGLRFRHWYGAEVLSVFNENDIGIFSRASIEAVPGSGIWDVLLDTRRLNNGEHRIKVRATDIFGNITDKEAVIMVDNGLLLADGENPANWNIYTGGGSDISLSSEKGLRGQAVKVHYIGNPSGWWGVRKKAIHSFSSYTGLELDIKGTTTYKIRIQLTDSESKLWEYVLTAPAEWTTMRVPFSDFKIRGDYQFASAPKNNVLKLDRVFECQIIHAIDNQGAEGTFTLDEVRLYK